MRAAVIDETGTAVNVVLVDDPSDYDPGEGLGLLEVDDDSPVAPGWRHDDGTWTEPDPTTPTATPPLPVSLADVQAQVDELWDFVLFGGGL